MTATLIPSEVPAAARVSVARAYRFELVKLLAQWRVRLLILACWIGPGIAVAVVSQQSSLPADTLFGRWMHATGWAGALVVLGFASNWVLPLITSVVAGDVFSSEDRLGTWRHLLVAVRSPRRIFIAKATASLCVLFVLVSGMAISGIVGGIAGIGSRPLVGLDGHLLSPGDAFGNVLLAWACVLAPTLALAAIGLLGSVALGRSPMGLLLPAFAGIALQLAQALPMPAAVRLALPSYAFLSWNGLFTGPQQLGPLLTGSAVSLAWAVTATAMAYLLFVRRDNPEYSESDAGEYQRTYDTEEDVLGHQRSGFLWTAVESAGATAKNYGEFEYMEGKPSGTWQQYYCASKSVMAGGDPAQLTAAGLKGNYGSAIPSLNAIADPQAPPFDLSIPDIYRYEIWKQDFQKNGPANFNMIWLSSDHTGGPTDGEAGVADNDLATGDIVDTISHSKYWKDSAIFVLEDDSQDGADHVDGHRAPVQVISPWSQHGTVISTYYSQISAVRTIEQILGAQPLNEKVAAATPMYDAFTHHPNYTPFNAVPNQVPLTEAITTPPSCGLDTLGLTGAAAAALNKAETRKTAVPADEKATAAAWQAWLARQHTTGNGSVPDYANPEQMNRYTWYQAHDWTVPYPGDTKIYAPDQVPGAPLPSSDSQ